MSIWHYNQFRTHPRDRTLAIHRRQSLLGLSATSPSHWQVLQLQRQPKLLHLLTFYLGYSVLTYLLQIKDRHNGNLLIDREGHLIHIDWGFILESSPGGNFGFEAAPFKLPLEYIEVLGGPDSEPWIEFKNLVREGFESVRKHCDSIVSECRFLKLSSMQSSH